MDNSMTPVALVILFIITLALGFQILKPEFEAAAEYFFDEPQAVIEIVEG